MSKTSAAERQRRYRERRKTGRRVIAVEIDEIDLAAALGELEFLKPTEDSDAAVSRALSEMLKVLCRGLAE